MLILGRCLSPHSVTEREATKFWNNKNHCFYFSFLTLDNLSFFSSLIICTNRSNTFIQVNYAHLVAPIFVKHNQEYGHDNDDTDHDCSVENWIQGPLSNGICLFCEGSVDTTTTKGQLKYYCILHRLFWYTMPTWNEIAVTFQFKAVQISSTQPKFERQRSIFFLRRPAFLIFLDYYYKAFQLCKTNNKKGGNPCCLMKLLTGYESLLLVQLDLYKHTI